MAMSLKANEQEIRSMKEGMLTAERDIEIYKGKIEENLIEIEELKKKILGSKKKFKFRKTCVKGTRHC